MEHTVCTYSDTLYFLVTRKEQEGRSCPQVRLFFLLHCELSKTHNDDKKKTDGTTKKKGFGRLGVVKELVQKTLILRGTTWSFFLFFFVFWKKIRRRCKTLTWNHVVIFFVLFLWFWEENSEERGGGVFWMSFLTNTTQSLFFCLCDPILCAS